MAALDDAFAQADDNRFAIALDNIVFPRYDRDGFATLTPAEQVFICVMGLEREVNNGGFDQFFWNSTGDVAQETLAALETIGAKRCADIVRRAIAAFPGGDPPRDRDARGQAILAKDDSVAQAWFDLDGEFFEYPDNLSALLRAYAEAHREEFRPWK